MFLRMGLLEMWDNSFNSRRKKVDNNFTIDKPKKVETNRQREDKLVNIFFFEKKSTLV